MLGLPSAPIARFATSTQKTAKVGKEIAETRQNVAQIRRISDLSYL